MARRCVVGVDVGGTKLLAAAVDEGLVPHEPVRTSSSAPDQAAFLDLLVDAVDAARATAPAAVEAIGVGLPCVFDASRTVAMRAVHLPVRGLRAAEVLSERTGLPVEVDNDANLAALAEFRHGAAVGADLAVVITVGTGVGGAVVERGRIMRGPSGAAGEMGHVVVDPEGTACGPGCPGVGCLETRVSGRGLVREALAAAERHPGSALAQATIRGGVPAGPVITEMALAGDPGALEALERVGWWLGIGLVGVINTFAPDVVVIGGGLAGAGELLLAPARELVAERVLPPLEGSATPIVAARFGEQAGLIGAASLALEGPL